MWFIFSQLRELGRSTTAQYFGIASLDEARAYLAHPVLGPRLVQATQVTLDADARSLNDLFGTPDDLKFCSSMMLFDMAGGPRSIFARALMHWCAGEADKETLRLLRLADDDAP